MKKVFAVMQSQDKHDNYDNFGDFLLGVELGELGFKYVCAFFNPDDSELDVGILGTNSEAIMLHREELTDQFRTLWESGDLNGSFVHVTDNYEFNCFAWYEDAINAARVEIIKYLTNEGVK